MENTDLTKTEIIDLVVEYINNNTRQVLYFIKNDCNIKFEISTNQTINAYGKIVGYTYHIKYNDKLSNIQFHSAIYNDITCIYNTDSKTVLINLFELLSDEEIENIKNVALKMKERKKITDENKSENKKIDFILNNVLNNNNYISINNTIDLKSYIKIANNIENKQDVLNLIDEMEKAQKDNKPKDFLEKLSKLLEIVKNTADITPLVIKGINWLIQFF
ncbi:hypothetical protein EPJ66_01115 [Brachyspira aalborgi]|uniref:hypothetical protein n=1 Tax=Brachyspira aalborgi TaxID=29522 RepID=UPI0011C9A267|nr:hypothetical protein [Brachyspira aalborgi]TXJ54368.1 hypothetical protein EPJ66_01115 [Brachyspira aalborgi]